MTKQTASNNAALARIKATFNSKIYATALKLFNEQGEQAARDYIGSFFNDVVRTQRVADLFRETASNLTPEARDKGRATGNAKQAEKAINEYWDLLAGIYRLRAHGATMRDVADSLNARGITTRQGASWTSTQVHRLLERTEGRLEFVVEQYRSRGWVQIKGGFTNYTDAELFLKNVGSNPKELKVECYAL